MHSLRDLRLTIAVILAASFALAIKAYSSFPSSGVPIYREQEIHLTNYSTAALTGGGLIQVWAAADLSGYMRAYAGIADQNQRLLQPDEPLVLSRAERHAFNVQVVAASDGAAIVSWMEQMPGGPFLIKLQRISAEGQIFWRSPITTVFLTNNAAAADPRLYADGDGGCLIAASCVERERRQIMAYTSAGGIRAGWPEPAFNAGLDEVKEIYPHPDGGFWLVKRNGSFNLVNRQGVRLWEEDRRFVHPVNGNPDALLETTSNGEYLFALFGGGFRFAIAVYGDSGEPVAGQIILERNSNHWDAIFHTWKVSDEGQVFFAYTLSFYIGCANRPGGPQCSGDYYPDGMPWIVRYNPFSEQHLPWGEFGRQIQRYEDWLPETDDSELAIMGDKLLFYSTNRIYGLNLAGEPAWETQPTVTPFYRAWYGRYAHLFPGGSHAWVVSLNDARPVSCRLNRDGSILAGLEPLYLIPHQRATLYPVYLSSPGAGQLRIIGVDHLRGIVGQKVSDNGEITAPLIGDVVAPPNRSFDYCIGGELAGRTWLYRWDYDYYLPPRVNVLYILDADGRLRTSRPLDLAGEGARTKLDPVDNGLDRVLFSFGRDGNRIQLMAFNLDGELAAETLYTNFFPNSNLNSIKYWPGKGWITITSAGSLYVIDLLDDQLSRVWAGPLIVHQPVKTFGWTDSTLLFYGDYFRVEDSRFIACREVCDHAGNLQAQDTTLLFDLSLPCPYYDRYTRWVPTPDGYAWIIRVSNEPSARIQLLGPDGSRLLGDNGLMLGILSHRGAIRILPEANGGGWVIWKADATIKALHFAAAGRLFEDYPPTGLNVFNEGCHNLIGARLDESSGQAWVVSRHETKLDFNHSVADLCVQILGEEWAGAPLARPTIPQSASLVCYPNPFNSTATISYSLPEPGFYTVDVVDVSGRLLARLSLGWKEAGNHRQVWDGTGIAAGAAFIRLEGAGASYTRPIVLVK